MNNENENENSEEIEKGSSGMQKRIRKLSADKRELAAQFEAYKLEMQPVMEKLQAFEAVMSQRNELQSQIDTLHKTHETERTIMSKGILDETGIDVVKYLYSKLGEGAPNIGDWLSGDNLPQAIRPYMKTNEPVAVMTQAVESVPMESEPVAAPPQTSVSANAGTTTKPQYTGNIDLNSIATPEGYAAVRDQLIDGAGFLKS